MADWLTGNNDSDLDILRAFFGAQREPTVWDNMAGLGKSFAGARYNLKGANLAPLQNIAGEIGRLSKAQYDPNDPLFQSLANEERGNIQQDMAASIAEAVRQNRKLSSMGRTPLFDASRGGEMQFRAMTQGYSDAQSKARDRARQILGAGQNAQIGNFAAQSTLTGLKDTNQKRKAYGLGNIADALPFLGRML